MLSSDDVADSAKNNKTSSDVSWEEDADRVDDGRDDFEEEVDEVEATEATGEPLEELESEERSMLTDDEASESIGIDEDAALRDIMIAERSMESSDVDAAGDQEFVCQSCFLVKPYAQLRNKRKKICIDCAG
ncbi:MAG: DUF4193 family protein [Acidobacteria bacterium]|nr:DUF4193 family protein [Acidobacteriota bacterium]